MSEIAVKSNTTDLISSMDNEYIHAATSDNTRRAYCADIEHFESMGGQLLATAQMVANYLKECAAKHNPRTLSRRLTAIRQWHKLRGDTIKDPTQSPIVTKTMRGIARLHGKPRRQALALRLKEFDQIAKYLIEHESVINIRNRAIMLVGFFGAFRRSELVDLKKIPRHICINFFNLLNYRQLAFFFITHTSTY
jgi:site-specific recombinase XerD